MLRNTMSNYRYNLKRQVEDKRDYKVAFPRILSIPNKVDLAQNNSLIFDQGSLGSCTANAGVACKMFVSKINTVLSRLYLYYKERYLEGNVEIDSGATMRSICKALYKYGVCEECYFPYNIKNFTKTPTEYAEINASNYKISSYKSLNNVNEIMQYLALFEEPVLIGMDIYESFESKSVDDTGIVPVPNKNREKLLGAHAVLVVGYEIKNSLLSKILNLLFGTPTIYLKCRNSWGDKWGDKGYFYLPKEYFDKGFTFDYWVIQ